MAGPRQPTESSARGESPSERAADTSKSHTPNDAPLVGYNTNFRHANRLFHVQTEDSGVQHPHVITHVFADGGRIIASRKTSYAHLLSHPDVPGVVRRLMKEQHKALLLEIRQGSYDQPARAKPTQQPAKQPVQEPAAAASPPPVPARRAKAAQTPADRPRVTSSAVTRKPVPTLHELILRYLDEEL